MKRLLITGAYGLVGSNICKVLEHDFPEIEITKVKHDEHKMVIDRETYDYIVYAAGYGQPLKFLQDKLETIDIHCGFPLKMALKGLKKYGTFLYISSSEVYSGAPSPHTEDMIGTTTPQHPRACYIEGKRCGEAICMAYKEQGFNVKIARLALAYGPGTKKGDTRVINQFIERALTKKQIEVTGDGSAMRTYCYIGDVVDQLLWILTKGDKTVYNVGGISRTSIRDLALEIAAIANVSVTWRTAEGVVGAPDDVCLDMSWWHNPFTLLRDGLRLTINYQKQLYGKV